LKRSSGNIEILDPPTRGYRWLYQNSILIAEVLGRALIAIVIATFLVAPLIALSIPSLKSKQLAVISVCILVFSFFVAVALRISNLEMIAISAAYAAVLSALWSNLS
jgi:Ca2+/Na+ antiporter